MQEDSIKVVCSHDGYRRLTGQPTHRRQWLFETNSLLIEDTISGFFGHAEARFHLHPGLILKSCDDGLTGLIGLEHYYWVKWRVEIGELKIEESTYHPRFGVREPSRCLVLNLDDGRGRIKFDWK